tara:strand:+ start:6743 stop:7885 length:1143 start_codon:yes stop_codon:yes gene_type:complete
VKITIIGAGNAGCLTALHYGWYCRKAPNVEVELIHNPDIKPEPVGQATFYGPPRLLNAATNFNWYDNKIHATFKSGIEYEGWGKKNDKFFHPFFADRMAMHFCPVEMQESVLSSGHFKVTEGDVNDISSIDSDYIFDCRGKPTDLTDYDELKNPLNACILGKPNWKVEENPWSRHVATPDGWTFVIPSHPESPSRVGAVGYLYNTNITSKEDAEKNFLEMFDVDITGHLNFNNYVAKNPVIDERIFLNGNRLFFLEPLESTAIGAYLDVVRMSFDVLFVRSRTFSEASKGIKKYIEEIQNFILWHYQFGSKYDTPFWNYAKKLTFKDANFNLMLKEAKRFNEGDVMPPDYGGDPTSEDVNYAQWFLYSFKNWHTHMTENI